MKIRDVMTAGPATIDADASVAEAMRLMLERKVSGLPVVSGDGALVGILTEGDLLRRAELGTERRRPHWLEYLLSPGRLAAEYVRSHGRKVCAVMSDRVLTIDADADLQAAVAIMEKHQVKRLPVLDGGKLAGVVSRADLMRAFLDAPPPPGVLQPDDTGIARSIRAEIDRQPWSPLENIAISVRHGIVEVTGVVTDERTREGLLIIAENTAGVARVVDRILVVEPMSGVVLNPPEDARSQSTSRKDPAR